MKNTILAVSTEKQINIGDYIQALAARQYFNNIDYVIEREELGFYEGHSELKLIMNGWFLHNHRSWPPSNKIFPLFVSFHINSTAKKILLDKISIEYLKKHQPIGCRDRESVILLKESGVDAYFSGCLTLTLGLKYETRIKNDKVYIVDPIIPDINKNPWFLLRLGVEVLFNYRSLVRISNQMLLGSNIKNLLKTENFINIYSKTFSRKTLINATYVNHQNDLFRKKYPTNNELLNHAESLLKNYAQAGLVITSRIHAALPCLALGTKVLFLEKANMTKASSCRLDGLRDFFNVLVFDKKGASTAIFDKSKLIDFQNAPENKSVHTPYLTDLLNICSDFTAS